MSDDKALAGLVSLTSLPKEPRLPLLIERLDPKGHSMLYGTGGVGKGSLASHWTTRLLAAGESVAVLDFEDHLDEWQERIIGLSDEETASKVMYRNVRRATLWDIADDMAAAFDELGVTYVVIDSVLMATQGMDPIKPETPAKYEDALITLGTRSLSLAHVNRASEHRYPFGSVYWHNLMRLTWSLEGGQGGQPRHLHNRKANRYPYLGEYEVDLQFDAEGVLRKAVETPHAQTVEDRIRAVLKSTDGDVPRDEVKAAMTDIKADTLRKAINRAVGSGWLEKYEDDDGQQHLRLGS